MKKLTLLLLLTTYAGFSQTYVQVDFDPNKMFGIIDNPRTDTQHRGFDFDIEAGAINDNFAMNLFYGYFHNARYQNYGFGADYYVVNNNNLSIGIGGALSVVLRKNPERQTFDIDSYGGHVGYHLRTVGVLWFSDRFGATGTLQWQNRGDLDIHGIIEGKIGLRYNIKTK